MDCGTFTFGKHRGLPSCDVPMKYLEWAMETMASPHQCVIDELRRRASCAGSRDAIAAQAAIGAFDFKRARSAPVMDRAARPAKVAHAGELVGEAFHKNRGEWLAMGGDPRSCPFDC